MPTRVGIESRLKRIEDRLKPPQRTVIVHLEYHPEDTPAQAMARKERAITEAEAMAEPALSGQETLYIIMMLWGFYPGDLDDIPRHAPMRQPKTAKGTTPTAERW